MRTNLLSVTCIWRIRLLILVHSIVLPALLLLVSAQKVVAASGTSAPVHAQTSTKPLPRPDHIVIVIEENKGFDDVFSSECPANSGKPCASYFRSIAAKGASLEQFFAFHHPSQPNYIEMFSGSNHGIIGDCCPLEKCQPQDSCNTACTPSLAPPVLKGPSLFGLLLDKNKSLPENSKRLTFVGYAEGLPKEMMSCCSGEPESYYARKHCPWLDFLDVPETNPDGKPTTLKFDREFWRHKEDLQRFSTLPTVSLVIPNLINDMHSLQEHAPHKTWPQGPKRQEMLGRLVNQGDIWLKEFIADYAEYAMKPENNSLLIITWDEDSNGRGCKHPCPTVPPDNHIPTIFVGAKVKSGYKSKVQYTHHNLLRTILDMYDLPLIGGGQRAEPITDIWK